MAAIDYAQNAAAENRFGLHYSGLTPMLPCKTITCAAKSREAAIESAKLG
jgi:hypothetical protein